MCFLYSARTGSKRSPKGYYLAFVMARPNANVEIVKKNKAAPQPPPSPPTWELHLSFVR